jgi:hypothetical protein
MRSTAITAHATTACTAPARTAAAPARQPAAPRRQVVRRAIEAPGAVEVPPVSDEVAAKMAELNIDFERSGLKYLPNEARVSQPASRPPLRPPAASGPLRCRAAGATARALVPPALCFPTSTPLPPPHTFTFLLFLPTCLPCTLQMRALDRKSTKFEKTKNEKCGSHMWSDVTELAQLIR